VIIDDCLVVYCYESLVLYLIKYVTYKSMINERIRKTTLIDEQWLIDGEKYRANLAREDHENTSSSPMKFHCRDNRDVNQYTARTSKRDNLNGQYRIRAAHNKKVTLSDVNEVFLGILGNRTVDEAE
jgi:hypothetical protein